MFIDPKPIVLVVGLLAGAFMLAMLSWSIAYPARRVWPPEVATRTMKILVWSMTILMVFFLGLFLPLNICMADNPKKQKYTDQVIIEHAELIPSSQYQHLSNVFLTIWNGTDKFIQVDTIEAQQESALLLSNRSRAAPAKDADRIQYPILIPPHSEFVMGPKGIFLQIRTTKPINAGSTFLLAVNLNDGRKLFADAKVLSADAEPTHHHHADGEC